MSKFKFGLFGFESALFLSVQLLGILVGLKLFEATPVPKMETGASIVWFLVSFVLVTILILLALKYLKFKIPFGIVFAFLIFVGADIVFSAFIKNSLIAVALALLVVALRFLWPNVLTQNIAIIIAIAGVSAQLGALLTPQAVIILLVILSLYDVWAVFKTKHMVGMARGLIQRGMMPVIVLPDNWRNFTAKLETVKKSKLKPSKEPSLKYVMLGTGDLAFPLVFAVSVLSYGIQSAFAVVIGAFFGVLFIHILMTSKKFSALPALPPIAIGSIIAFVISTFL